MSRTRRCSGAASMQNSKLAPETPLKQNGSRVRRSPSPARRIHSTYARTPLRDLGEILSLAARHEEAAAALAEARELYWQKANIVAAEQMTDRLAHAVK